MKYYYVNEISDLKIYFVSKPNHKSTNAIVVRNLFDKNILIFLFLRFFANAEVMFVVLLCLNIFTYFTETTTETIGCPK